MARQTRTKSTRAGLAVLGISSNAQTSGFLASIVARMGWAYRAATSYADALRQFEEADNPPAVVVTEPELPDGTWRDVMQALSTRAAPPRVVVAARHADERFWTDVLDHGGFDVVEIPHSDQREIRRVLKLAQTEWERRHA
jgi:DNA-binding NtrC family response regulator